MAALTALAVTGPTSGTTAVPAAVSSSDTIAEAQFGSTGVHLRVINGSGGSINVTVSDPNPTAMGNTAAGTAVAVANGAAKTIFIPRSAISTATGLATVAFSGTTSVTYELYKV